MNQNAIRLLAFGFCFFVSSVIHAQEEPDYPLVVQTCVSVFEGDHLLRQELDEPFFDRWFDNFLVRLDPQKLYFLQADIDEYHEATRQLPDFAKSGDLTFCNLVMDRFQERIRESLSKAGELVDTDFDFTISEELTLAHEHPPENENERDERWRREVKFATLLEISNGSNLVVVREFLHARYDAILSQAVEMDEAVRVQIYLDAFCRAKDIHSGYLSQTTLNSFMGGKLRKSTIGCVWRDVGGRKIISSIRPNFHDATISESIVGCELMAICDQSGVIHNFREMDNEGLVQLIQLGLSESNKVTLELYDPVRLRRFSVSSPRLFAR